MPGRAGHSVRRRQFAAVTELFDHVGHAVLRRGERGYAGSLNESGSARDRVADQARRRPDQWLRHGRITQRHPVAPRPGVGRGASQPPAGPRPGDPAGGMFGALMIVRNSSSFGPSATSTRLTATPRSPCFAPALRRHLARVGDAGTRRLPRIASSARCDAGGREVFRRRRVGLAGLQVHDRTAEPLRFPCPSQDSKRDLIPRRARPRQAQHWVRSHLMRQRIGTSAARAAASAVRDCFTSSVLA